MAAFITINNASDATIHATVESARSILASESHHEKMLRQSSSGGGFTIGAKGASLGANGESAVSKEEIRTIAKEYSVRHGPAAGYMSIRPGRQGEFGLPDASADAYFLTLSDGERVIAYRASLDTSEHDFIEVAGSGDSLHFDVTPDSPLIKNGASISLKIGSRFVGMPSEAKNWPAGVLSSAPGAHRIQRTAGGKGAIRSGDIVRLKGNVLGADRDYCYLYSSDKGWIYYDLKSSNEKQLWIIGKVGGGTGPIRAGERVLLINYYWRNSQLRPGPDGKWLACDSGRDAAFEIGLM